MKMNIDQYIDELIERHLPVGFIEYETLTEIKNLFLNRKKIGRKEALILAYLIGVNSEEADELLSLSNHPTLYVKRREDAVWKYMLDHRYDSAFILDEIYPQNVDEALDQI